MAIDLLITSASASRMATMESEHLLPAIGNDPFNCNSPGTLVSTMELYTSPSSDRPVYLLTQRSPPIIGQQSSFATSVVQWAKAQGVGRIILLTGLDASFRKDRQLLGPNSTRFLIGGGDIGGDLSSALESLKALEPLEAEYREEEEASHGLLPPWATLGALEAEQVPYLMLGAFAIEGDNVSTAVEVAKMTMMLASGLSSEVKMPCSFTSVYGRSMGLHFLA